MDMFEDLNPSTDNKRKLLNDEEFVSEAKTKRPCSTNNSFRYWQVEVTNSNDSQILKATKAKISKAIPISPTSIGLRFLKSMTYQQVKTILKDYHCGDVTRMECSTFRKFEMTKNGNMKTNKTSRPKICPTNSYYTFTTAGETFTERVANIKKILMISPIKKTFSSDRRLSRNGIRDIHFFNTDLLKGCFYVRNKKHTEKEEGHSLVAEEFNLTEYYKGLLINIEKISHENYKSLIRQRNMRRHIKSWICICPFFAENGIPSEVATEMGISTYRLFDNDIGIFQFESKRSAITPLEAAKAMGAMHKSLCFQSPGNVVRKLLATIDSNIVASMGDFIYRSKWRNCDKRATKCVKFYSIADDKKITDQDILDIVNTEKIFYNIHFREEERDYGVAKLIGTRKIVPNTIKLSDDSKIRFTAITFNEFNTEKATQGMNCFVTWRKGPKANTLENITSTAFSFEGLTKESVEGLLSQKKIKFLKAVKNEDTDSYSGVIKTVTTARGCNLVSKNNGKIYPEGKHSFQYKLKTLKEKKLAFDFSREEKKTLTGDNTQTQEDKQT